MVKLILGFSGVGKSTIYNSDIGLKCSDSDSSEFSWVVKNGERVRNPRFVEEYVHHLEKQLLVNDIVFGSTHPQIIKELQKRNIEHIIVTPTHSAKKEYVKRWENRGSDEKFIDLMTLNFTNFVDDILNSESNILILKDYQTMEDALKILGKI